MSKQPALDISYARAVPVLIHQARELNLYLAGCGGTGGWLAPAIVRLVYQVQNRWDKINVTFVDPDRVEAANIPRQNFCQAEIGHNKAEALALRYGTAWGIEIGAIAKRFAPEMIKDRHYPNNALNVIVGCVDNAAARQSIAKTLKSTSSESPPSLWWLDCGNARESGQVLLGSAGKTQHLRHAFDLVTQCTALPSPALLHPELLKPQPEEIAGHAMSCAQIAAANAQSLAVNQQVAAIAADYLVRLLCGDLRRFATYFDLGSGSARSKYITPEDVAGAVGQTPRSLFGHFRQRQKG